MKTEQPMLIITVTAATPISKGYWLQSDGTLAGAGETAVGLSHIDTEPGLQCPVVCEGVALGLSGAAVAKDAQVASDANGKVVPAASGSYILGKALDAASGAGEYIRVHFNPGFSIKA